MHAAERLSGGQLISERREGEECWLYENLPHPPRRQCIIFGAANGMSAHLRSFEVERRDANIRTTSPLLQKLCSHRTVGRR